LASARAKPTAAAATAASKLAAATAAAAAAVTPSRLCRHQCAFRTSSSSSNSSGPAVLVGLPAFNDTPHTAAQV
jgi:hypothetical protein